jgi:phosphopantetheine adenylyltransferase
MKGRVYIEVIDQLKQEYEKSVSSSQVERLLVSQPPGLTQ